MKNCPYCQKEIASVDVKCPHCGGWFTNDAADKQKEIDQERQLEKLVSHKKGKEDLFSETTRYFGVPVARLVVLSMVSFGIYEVYWFYQNWKAVKEQEQLKIRPFWRAIFCIFYAYPLFKRIMASAYRSGGKIRYSAAQLTLIYIALDMSYRLPDPWGWISTLSFLPLIPVVHAIHTQNTRLDPAYVEKRPFRRGEKIILVLGIILCALNILSYLFPEEEEVVQSAVPEAEYDVVAQDEPAPEVSGNEGYRKLEAETFKLEGVEDPFKKIGTEEDKSKWE